MNARERAAGRVSSAVDVDVVVVDGVLAPPTSIGKSRLEVPEISSYHPFLCMIVVRKSPTERSEILNTILLVKEYPLRASAVQYHGSVH